MTRKVKEAKDLESNELIYFKGHAKATYMSDGRSVEDAINQIGAGGGTADLSGYATKDELANKVDKVDGKQLSTEDFTTLLKQKLDGLQNYDDTEVQQTVSKLRTDLDTLVSGDTTTAIKTFNEVIAFLEGVSDTEDLEGIIASIEQQIAGKMDKITLAPVAISGSYNDLSDKPTIPSAVTESTVGGWGFTKNTGTITEIKMNGTSKGSSGVVDLGTVITSHQDISGKQDKLVSGTNIKTVNGQPLLGSGDLTIAGNGDWSGYPVVYVTASSANIDMKPYTIYYLNDSAATGVTITSLIGDTADSCNEYILIFKDTSDITLQPFTLTLPSNIKFSGHKVTPYFGVWNILHIRNGFAYLDYRMEIPSPTYEHAVDHPDIFNIYKYFLAEGQKTGAMWGFFEPSRFEAFFSESSVNKYTILLTGYYEYYTVYFFDNSASWEHFTSINEVDLYENCAAWVRFNPNDDYFTENEGFKLY